VVSAKAPQVHRRPAAAAHKKLPAARHENNALVGRSSALHSSDGLGRSSRHSRLCTGGLVYKV
jgi:hypothetical protein